VELTGNLAFSPFLDVPLTSLLWDSRNTSQRPRPPRPVYPWPAPGRLPRRNGEIFCTGLWPEESYWHEVLLHSTYVF